MKKTAISIVILNWNGAEILDTCLQSVEKQTEKPYEVIVVDNGSTDHSVSLVKKKYPFAKLICLPENLGFAEGNNIGLKEAKGDYIFALNNDTKLEPNFVKKLHTVIEKEKNPRVGHYSTKMIFAHNKKIDNIGISVNSFGFGGEIKDKSDFKRLIGPCGGAALYKREMLEDIKDKNGYYDKRFFIYFEDSDLAVRARNKGWICKPIAEAKMLHLNGATTKKMKNVFLYYFLRNRVLSYFKNQPSWLRTVVFTGIQGVVLVKYALEGRLLLAYNAIKDGYQAKIHPPKKVFKKYN